MNKIMLIGNLGRNPEMSYTAGGTAVTKFTLAVNRRVKSQSPTGERQTETDWFNIVAWDRLAETCNAYLKQGSKVYIEGRLSVRKYNDREGVQRTAVEVIANDMEMLTPKSQQESAPSGGDNFLNSPEDDLGDIDEHPF